MKTLLPLLAFAAALPFGDTALAQSRGAGATETERRAEALLSAVVHVRVRALPDARTGPILGLERAGSGVAIDEEGHVLTIGYLVLEPDAIEVTGPGNKTVPATLVGYDHDTGFGLLKLQGPLAVKPMVLGESSRLVPQEPVMMLSWGGPQTASVGKVVARREFTGAWEYLIDDAIFVSPPTMGWAGAALVTRDFKLVGIGSLLVRNTVPGADPTPGNMFVPIDLLKPILADLQSRGRAAHPPRPWLGLRTESVQGRVFVTGVSEDGPADRAGIRPGDVVLAVGPEPVDSHASLYRRVWALGPAGVAVPLKVLQGGEVREVRIDSIDRSTFFRSKPAY